MRKIDKNDRENQYFQNPFLKCKALKLLLDDEIFEMINFVDGMKIMISNYFAPNLMIDMDITPKIFNAEDLILKNSFEIEGKNKKNFFQDVMYFGIKSEYPCVSYNIENQICYSQLKNNSALNLIFNRIIDIEYSEMSIFYILRGIVNVALEINGGREYYAYKKIFGISINQKRMHSEGVSGISDESFVPSNQESSSQSERSYEFKENWIQDGLKYDINNNSKNILDLYSALYIGKKIVKF